MNIQASLPDNPKTRSAQTPDVSAAPLISVVTPSYNQGAYIEDCIQSVLAQNYPRFEHIVYDNCSTDRTLDVLRRHDHLDWTSEPDTGQSDALNKAIRKARGEIIAWINADDTYEPDAFALAARELRRDTGVMAVAGRVRRINSDGSIRDTTTPRFDGIESMLPFWNGGYGLCQPGVFFRREVIDQLGGFRTDLHYAMDYDFWLRLAEHFPIKTVERVIARYVFHSASKSGRSRFGKGFNEELEQVSRRYWGARFGKRHRRFSRQCNRFVAGQFMNAFVFAHNRHDRIDWTSLWGMVRRRPATLFHRYVIAVMIERVVGIDRCNAMKASVRRWTRLDFARGQK